MITDPCERAEIMAWIEAHEFKSYEHPDCYERCYTLSYDHITLEIYIPKRSACARLILSRGNVDERQRFCVGSAFTADTIDALWTALNLGNYDNTHKLMEQAHAYYRQEEALAESAK